MGPFLLYFSFNVCVSEHHTSCVPYALGAPPSLLSLSLLPTLLTDALHLSQSLFSYSRCSYVSSYLPIFLPLAAVLSFTPPTLFLFLYPILAFLLVCSPSCSQEPHIRRGEDKLFYVFSITSRCCTTKDQIRTK